MYELRASIGSRVLSLWLLTSLLVFMNSTQAKHSPACDKGTIETSYFFGESAIKTKVINTKRDLVFDMSIRPKLIRLVNVASLMEFTEIIDEWAVFTFTEKDTYADMQALVGSTAIVVRLDSLGEIKFGQSLFESTECIEYLGTKELESNKHSQITRFLLYRNIGAYVDKRIARN